MHWYVRRYQPYSTTGTASGKKGKEIGQAAKVRSRITKTGKKIDKLASRSVSDKAGSIQRQMNRIEKETVANLYESRQSKERMDILKNVASKRMTKSMNRKNGPTARDAKKIQKLETKINKEKANYDAANANVKKGESETWKLIAKAAKNNYNVSTRKVDYFQKQGELMVLNIIGGPYASAAYMATNKKEDLWQTGYKYKVRASKKKQLNPN